MAFLLILTTEHTDANKRTFVETPDIVITELLPEPEVLEEIASDEITIPEPIIENGNTDLGSGPEDFAAEHFEVVDDNLLENNPIDYATTEDVWRASALGGNGIDDGKLVIISNLPMGMKIHKL